MNANDGKFTINEVMESNRDGEDGSTSTMIAQFNKLYKEKIEE